MKLSFLKSATSEPCPQSRMLRCTVTCLILYIYMYVYIYMYIYIYTYIYIDR